MLVPFFIPKGTRIAVRGQSSNASDTLQIAIHLYAAGLSSPVGLGSCETFGANTADSGGVQIDPGSTANTKGSWTEIVSSTTNDVRWLAGILGHNGDTSTGSQWVLYDVAIGAAAAEEIIIENLPFRNTSFEAGWGHPFFGPVDIPAGSRIAVRAQSSENDSNRYHDIVLYGFS